MKMFALFEVEADLSSDCVYLYSLELRLRFWHYLSVVDDVPPVACTAVVLGAEETPVQIKIFNFYRTINLLLNNDN